MCESQILKYLLIVNLFGLILVEYGLFDQLRVDHGKEWVLSLFVQEKLAHLR